MLTPLESLNADHRMIRKLLGGLRPGEGRFTPMLATLSRVVRAHAWFEDEFLLPAMKARPSVFEPFCREIAREHQDISRLLTRTEKSAAGNARAAAMDLLTLRALLNSHFLKEEEGLFPLAESVISDEDFARMGVDMERRKREAGDFSGLNSPHRLRSSR